MTPPVPSHHQNQETTLDEPVYLFTERPPSGRVMTRDHHLP
jgi:hypothetical protein